MLDVRFQMYDQALALLFSLTVLLPDQQVNYSSQLRESSNVASKKIYFHFRLSIQ